MARKFSTGLRNALLGLQASPACLLTNTSTGTTISYADNGASADTITRLAGSFIADGLVPGMKITTEGSTTGGNDISGIALTAVAALTLTFATGTLAASEAFAAGTAITAAEGGSFKDVMQDGVLGLYSGGQPADADTAESGTLLVLITVSSGAFVADAEGNGLEFGTAAAGVIAKDTDVWSGVGLVAGSAGWFRFWDNGYATGASTSELRFDGSVATSGAQLNMSSTTIAVGATTTIDTFTVTLAE